jgi:hypothetical protein
MLLISLAKFLQDYGASQCMSAIAGSYGYIAPGKIFILITVHVFLELLIPCFTIVYFKSCSL